MKKIISFFAFLILSVGAFAQAKLKTTATGSTTSATITNASYTYLYSGSTPIVKNFAPTGVTTQVNFTKNNGTMTLTVSLWGSVDNVSWELASTDSASISNGASQAKYMKATGLKYPYYRARIITTGTQSTTVDGAIFVN